MIIQHIGGDSTFTLSWGELLFSVREQKGAGSRPQKRRYRVTFGCLLYVETKLGTACWRTANLRTGQQCE